MCLTYETPVYISQYDVCFLHGMTLLTHTVSDLLKEKKKKKKEKERKNTHTPQPLNPLLLSEFHMLKVLFLFNCGAFYMSLWNFILYFWLLIKFVDIILFIVLSSKMHATSPNLVLYVNLRIVFFIPKSLNMR